MKSACRQRKCRRNRRRHVPHTGANAVAQRIRQRRRFGHIFSPASVGYTQSHHLGPRQPHTQAAGVPIGTRQVAGGHGNTQFGAFGEFLVDGVGKTVDGRCFGNRGVRRPVVHGEAQGFGGGEAHDGENKGDEVQMHWMDLDLIVVFE